MGADSLPDFVIVGAPRSGTSTLYRFLTEHPDVFMAAGKELRFFDQHYDWGLDWYRSQFRAARNGQRIGEASPGYLAYPGALERLADAVPHVRVIAIFRDPVDRAYSHYWMRRSLRLETRSWAAVIEDDLDSTDVESVFWHSRYAVHLERLSRLFRSDRSLLLSFDGLTAAPAAFAKQVCEFLDTAPQDPASIGRLVNPHIEIRSMTLRRVTRVRWLPRWVRSSVGRINQVATPYEPMERSVREHLDDLFQGDRDALHAALEASSKSP